VTAFSRRDGGARLADRPQGPHSLSMDAFHERGFVVLPGIAPAATVGAMRERALADLAGDVAPVEREADVGYPGAPASPDAPGGRTVRRLLRAADRDPVFRDWALAGPHLPAVARALADPPVRFCQTHHDCVMTKHPVHSSDTGWHRDVRYWSFARPHLVTAWLALTEETNPMGSLSVVPGSHRLDLAPDRFDAAQFLDEGHPDNAALLRRAVSVELQPGDVLLFHARLLHRASRNHTDRPKLAAVFTYLGGANARIPGSRSARRPALPAGVAETVGAR